MKSWLSFLVLLAFGVTNGLFSATSGGGDPQFLSPDNLNLNLSGITSIYLRLRNGSVLTAALLPLPNPAYIPPVYPWVPNAQMLLFTGGDNRLLATGNGFEPTLTCSADLSSLATPAKLIVQMQSRSFGDGRLFWRLPGQTHFTAAQSVSFAVTHDDTLHTYASPFSPGGPIAQLRLQPASDVADSEIASIQLLNAIDRVLHTWLWPDPGNDGDGHTRSHEQTENRDPE